MAPPGPVKIGHKKDGHRRRPHRFHVSRPPLTRPLDPLLVNLSRIWEAPTSGFLDAQLQTTINQDIFCSFLIREAAELVVVLLSLKWENLNCFRFQN